MLARLLSRQNCILVNRITLTSFELINAVQSVYKIGSSCENSTKIDRGPKWHGIHTSISKIFGNTTTCNSFSYYFKRYYQLAANRVSRQSRFPRKLILHIDIQFRVSDR